MIYHTLASAEDPRQPLHEGDPRRVRHLQTDLQRPGRDEGLAYDRCVCVCVCVCVCMCVCVCVYVCVCARC